MKLLSHIRHLDKRGITIVWLALFMLVLLIMLAGLAVDIGYMYYVKNELQVAADAAAPAGASTLTSTPDTTVGGIPAFTQLTARQSAWRYACKNKAAGNSVFLNTNSSVDCDNPPDAGSDLNQSTNDPDGDIVVGHWTLPPAPSSVTCEPAGAGFFCPATGSTGLTINAMKARPRRTGQTAGMPAVSVFFGGIFRMIGTDWSLMSASASAIASPLTAIGPFPICLPSCTRNTPVDGQWEYKKDEPEPILCTDAEGSPPGQLYLFESSSEAEPKKPGVAWTNFVTRDCGQNCDMPNPGEILPYLKGAPVPEICKKNICTSNGSMGNLFDDLQNAFDRNKEQFTLEVGGTSVTITGWNMLIPIVDDTTCGIPNQTCPGAQNGAANPYFVTQFANVLVTEIVKPRGIRLIGLDNPRTFSQTVDCKKGTITVTRNITSISSSGVCADCQNPPTPSGGWPARLVK